MMIVNDIFTGIIAIIIAYLLGSIPSAYIAARIITRKDIRQMGGGNVGARNTFYEVGKAAGAAVAIFDIGKGAAAAAIALWLLDVPLYFALAAGLATVAGHIWSVFLRFTGGNGLGTSIGVLSVLLTWELLIAIGIIVLLIIFTRNPVLSTNISLLSVPISSWLIEEKSWPHVIFSIVLIVMLTLHFLPTARAAIASAGSKEAFFAELLRRNKAKDQKT
jgi:glycerol-3-phosphate acyltransferase PlsY